jgi:hypothetical protein
MSKSDITLEQARAVIDRVAQELGLLVKDTTGFIKIQGPANKHRVYVQRSIKMNRIDTTLAIPTDDPAYKPLTAPNGSVSCHVVPDLEQLERALRMLADDSIGTQVPNKPRPFAATKATPARKPKPVSDPVDLSSVDEPKLDGVSLKDRLKAIRDSNRRARVRRYTDDGMTEDEAEAVVSGKMTADEVRDARVISTHAELNEIATESGIEIYS